MVLYAMCVYLLLFTFSSFFVSRFSVVNVASPLHGSSHIEGQRECRGFQCSIRPIVPQKGDRNLRGHPSLVLSAPAGGPPAASIPEMKHIIFSYEGPHYWAKRGDGANCTLDSPARPPATALDADLHVLLLVDTGGSLNGKHQCGKFPDKILSRISPDILRIRPGLFLVS